MAPGVSSARSSTCQRIRVSDANRDAFAKLSDIHLGPTNAHAPRWDTDPQQFLKEIAGICNEALDDSLATAIHRFFTGGPTGPSSLILSNCGVDHDLPPTRVAMEANRDAMELSELHGTDAQTAAQAAVRAAFRKPSQLSEAWLFALPLLSGGTLTHLNPMETDRKPILSNIIPIPERAHYQANFGSSATLGLHRDGYFDGDGLVSPPYAPRAACLFCLRSNAAATTFLADNRAICNASEPNDLALLRTTPLSFRMRDTDNGGTPARYESIKTYIKPHPILHGSDTDPHLELNYDRDIDLDRCGCNSDVLAAYDRVKSAGIRVAQYVTLEPGDLLVMLNWRTQHGRTSFHATTSASERWLQRFWLFSAMKPDALAFDVERRHSLHVEPAAVSRTKSCDGTVTSDSSRQSNATARL